MPAPDRIHHAVKNALVKDGWTITDDPFTIEYEGLKLFADLGAERLLAVQKRDQHIVVEIKSFVGRSPVFDLEVALGQYVLYRSYLRVVAPDHVLYMAITEETYEDFFQQEAIRFVMKQEEVRLLVVNVQEEVVATWTN